MTFYRGRPLTGAEVEEAIEQTMDVLEGDVEKLGELSRKAAVAEAAYRTERARLLLMAPDTCKTDTRRDAYAQYHARDQFATRKIAEALRDTQQEACRVRRTELEALRTIAANARAAEHGRG